MVLPKQFPWYPECVPDELKVGRFWVGCDQRKVPLVAGSHRRASSTNPRTWRSFRTACDAYDAGHHAGVGRIIMAPYVGVDLDHCRDPQTRQIDPDALETLQLLDSYSEVSASGRGVKVWIRGDLDRSYVKSGLEVYKGGRYFATTGQLLSQFPAAIAPRQREIDELVRREFPRYGERRPSDLARTTYNGPPIDLADVLAGAEVLYEVPDDMGRKFRVRCPFADQHSDPDDLSGSYVGQMASGTIWFHCWHSHCSSRSWRDFRDRIALKAKKLSLIRRGIYQ